MKTQSVEQIVILNNDGSYYKKSVLVKEYVTIHDEPFFIHQSKETKHWQCSHVETGLALGLSRITKKELLELIECRRAQTTHEKLKQVIDLGKERLSMMLETRGK